MKGALVEINILPRSKSHLFIAASGAQEKLIANAFLLVHRVAKRARAFGIRIHYTNLHQLPEEKAGDAVFHADPLGLLRVSQFLSLHAPETEKTHHFLNAKTIALLPPGAIMINTARGGLIVDDDLIAALKSGRVAAAGLDVFEGEPKLNPGYAGLINTFLLPHIGAATVESEHSWEWLPSTTATLC